MQILSVVTIDGPAGAGKSSVARRVAEGLGFRFLDTGAMYRAVTLAALEADLPAESGEALESLADGMSLEFEADGKLLANGRDVTRDIRSREVTRSVSEYAALPEVRAAMSRLQREIGEAGRLVCEGRDMGSVVFPDAAVKVYLDASPEVRARRRRLQLEADGQTVNEAELAEEIRARDAFDAGREIAPLVRTKEQTLVDSSDKTMEGVVDEILGLARERLDDD